MKKLIVAIAALALPVLLLQTRRAQEDPKREDVTEISQEAQKLEQPLPKGEELHVEHARPPLPEPEGLPSPEGRERRPQREEARDPGIRHRHAAPGPPGGLGSRAVGDLVYKVEDYRAPGTNAHRDPDPANGGLEQKSQQS